MIQELSGQTHTYGSVPSGRRLYCGFDYMTLRRTGIRWSAKFEFVISLQPARTLGINVPPTLLAIADE